MLQCTHCDDCNPAHLEGDVVRVEEDVVCVEGGVCEGRCVWREMCGCVKVVCVVVRT